MKINVKGKETRKGEREEERGHKKGSLQTAKRGVWYSDAIVSALLWTTKGENHSRAKKRKTEGKRVKKRKRRRKKKS